MLYINYKAFLPKEGREKKEKEYKEKFDWEKKKRKYIKASSDMKKYESKRERSMDRKGCNGSCSRKLNITRAGNSPSPHKYTNKYYSSESTVGL